MKNVHFLVVFLLFIGANSAIGAVTFGGDIRYVYKGNGLYDVYVRSYRDCSGSPASSSTLTVKSSTTTLSFTNQTKVGVRDLTGVSPSCPNNSKCSSGGSNAAHGIEEHTWLIPIDLSSYNQCEWQLSWEQCCRNGNISTGSANENLHLTAVLNKCISGGNSSPVLRNAPYFLACVNQDYRLSLAAYDSANPGDSLSFHLVSPLKAANTSVSYTGQFSPLRPLNFFGFPNQNLILPGGFHLHPVTGQLSFKPLTLGQITNLCIEIKEWRRINGVQTLIGTSRTDFTLTVISCPLNTNPSIQANDVSYACVGEQKCISVAAQDEDASDTVRLSWNNGIPGASFSNNNGSVRIASGQVCWTPDSTHARATPYLFTVNAEDNACPYLGRSSKSIAVYVREKADGILHDTLLSCGRVAMDYTPLKSPQGFSFEYRILDSMRNRSWTGYVKQDTLALAPGKHFLQLVLSTGGDCEVVLEDTLQVANWLQVNLPSDTGVCAGDSLRIDALYTGGASPYLTGWYNLDTKQAMSGFDHVWRGKVNQPYRIAFKVEEAGGCVHQDSISIVPFNAPNVNLGADTVFCAYDLFALDAGGAGASWHYLWNTGDTTRQLEVPQTGTYSVMVRDSLGCLNSDTVQVTRNAPTVYGLFDTADCIGNDVFIRILGLDSVKYYNLAGFKDDGSDIPLQIGSAWYLTLDRTYSIIAQGKHTISGVTCIARDTALWQARPLPLVNAGMDQRICQGDSIRLEATSNAPVNYLWSDGTEGAQIWLRDAGTYAVSVKDIYQCENSDTLRLDVNPLSVSAGLDQSHCPQDSVYLIAIGADSFNWYDLGSYIPGSMNTPVAQSANYHYVLDETGSWLVEGYKTAFGLTCRATDTVSVTSYPVTPIKAILGDSMPTDKTLLYNYSVNPSGHVSFAWTV